MLGDQTGGSGVQINTSGSVTIDKTATANTNRSAITPATDLASTAGGAVVIKDTNVKSNGGLGAVSLARHGERYELQL